MASPTWAAGRRAILVAAIVWLALSVYIVLSNVVFARPQDDDDGLGVAVAYLGVFAALLLTGRLAARVAPDRRTHAFAGALAGGLIGSFTAGTFFAVDNIFLSTVAQQRTKIDGLAHSGMTSMREYLNQSLIGPLVLWTVAFAVIGAALAVAGGASARARSAPPTAIR